MCRDGARRGRAHARSPHSAYTRAHAASAAFGRRSSRGSVGDARIRSVQAPFYRWLRDDHIAIGCGWS